MIFLGGGDMQNFSFGEHCFRALLQLRAYVELGFRRLQPYF